MPWTLNTIADLHTAGFDGFVPVAQLRESLDPIPRVRGVYIVLRPNAAPPRFRAKSPAGRFKGKDPTIAVSELQSRWLPGTPVLYIGKAGSPTSEVTLRRRLREYIRHGEGRPIGHWGGRSIWQLEDSADLVFCWKPTPDEDPRDVERNLIRSFVERFERRPFANRTG